MNQQDFFPLQLYNYQGGANFNQPQLQIQQQQQLIQLLRHQHQQNQFGGQQQQQQQQPLPQFQQPVMPPQLLQQQPHQDMLPLDATSLRHLASAFRVGMLGLEALHKRGDSSHALKYRQSPPYADDVKWLFEIALRLDGHRKTTACLEQFCRTAAAVVQNPFPLQELAFDTAKYVTRGQTNQISVVLGAQSPLGWLSALAARGLFWYHKCCMSKMHHLTTTELDDFISMLVTARNLYYCSGNMQAFQDLLGHLRRSKSCKKDVWNKIAGALHQTF
jgi:hypothetical protein